MDFRCDLNCPANITDQRCCDNCARRRRYFISKENENVWDETTGFWRSGGCLLPRNAMPKECRENDCRDKDWVIVRRWTDGTWKDIAAHEIEKGHIVVSMQTVLASGGDGI